jgi:hypothetical protein
LNAEHQRNASSVGAESPNVKSQRDIQKTLSALPFAKLFPGLGNIETSLPQGEPAQCGLIWEKIIDAGGKVSQGIRPTIPVTRSARRSTKARVFAASKRLGVSIDIGNGSRVQPGKTAWRRP